MLSLEGSCLASASPTLPAVPFARVHINHYYCLFHYTSIPFGISSAPLTAYIDDIVVTGRAEKKHFRILDEVLTRLERHVLHQKKENCKFWCKEIEY